MNNLKRITSFTPYLCSYVILSLYSSLGGFFLYIYTVNILQICKVKITHEKMSEQISTYRTVIQNGFNAEVVRNSPLTYVSKNLNLLCMCFYGNYYNCLGFVTPQKTVGRRQGLGGFRLCSLEKGEAFSLQLVWKTCLVIAIAFVCHLSLTLCKQATIHQVTTMLATS